MPVVKRSLIKANVLQKIDQQGFKGVGSIVDHTLDTVNSLMGVSYEPETEAPAGQGMFLLYAQARNETTGTVVGVASTRADALAWVARAPQDVARSFSPVSVVQG